MAVSVQPRSSARTRLVAASVGAAMLVGTAAACAGKADSTADSFTVGIQSSYVAHLAPGRSGDTDVDNALWTPLTTIDPGSGKLVDAVAKSVTSSDQRVWTIKLRGGWTFHDGEPVTAQSFADSWNATAYGPNAMTDNYLFAIIKGYRAMNPLKGKPTAHELSGVQVAGKDTLRVTLTKPLSLFPYVIAGTPFAPIPKKALGDLDAFDKKPIGNGPYRLEGKGIQPGVQQLTLRRYDKYAGTKGHAARIDVKLFQDASAVYTSFRAGSVDLALVQGSDLTQAASQYANRLVRVPLPALVYLAFPLWDKRFHDPRTREAFSLAVNRTAIVKSLLHGSGSATNALAPSRVTGGGTSSCDYCGYDPGRARKLLSAAGGWHGKLTLWTDQDPTNVSVVQAVSNQLRTNLGISSIAIKQQPLDQLYPNLTAHKVNGPALLYLAASYPHLYSVVDQMFAPGSGTNVTGYDDPKVTALLGRAAASGDAKQVVSLTQDASRQALATLPVAPLYQPQGGLVHAEKLGGVVPEFLGGAHLASVTVGT